MQDPVLSTNDCRIYDEDVDCDNALIRGVFVCKLLYHIVRNGSVDTKTEFAQLLSEECKQLLSETVKREVSQVMSDHSMHMSQRARVCLKIWQIVCKPCEFQGHNVLIGQWQ